MDVIKLLAVVFVLSNFFYFVYPENGNLRKRFFISLGAILLFSAVFSLVYADNTLMMVEGIVSITGYFLLLFLAHGLIIKIFRIRKYYIYQLVFFLLFFFVTVFYTALIQDMFRYS